MPKSGTSAPPADGWSHRAIESSRHRVIGPFPTRTQPSPLGRGCRAPAFSSAGARRVRGHLRDSAVVFSCNGSESTATSHRGGGTIPRAHERSSGKVRLAPDAPDVRSYSSTLRFRHPRLLLRHGPALEAMRCTESLFVQRRPGPGPGVRNRRLFPDRLAIGPGGNRVRC